MNELHESILDAEFENSRLRRKDLLPAWIKVFIWIFMIMGAFVPFGFIAGIFGIPFSITLYGLGTVSPLSIMGIFLSGLYLFKGIIAFGLWTEKQWAVDMAIIDGLLGILICIVVMIMIPTSSGGISIRLDLIILIPYFLKMKNIKLEWIERVAY